jgi:hypothetical protein
MLLLSALDAAAAPVAAHRPHLPRCACAAAHRPAAGVVGWLSHEASPQHYSLALITGREGGCQRMQQALVMAPQRGVAHSGFLILSATLSLPYGSGSVGPCMWDCMNERETWAVWCEERAAGAACETSKAEVTCMARLVACRDAMAAGRGSGLIVGVRALWTIVRQTKRQVGG